MKKFLKVCGIILLVLSVVVSVCAILNATVPQVNEFFVNSFDKIKYLFEKDVQEELSLVCFRR